MESFKKTFGEKIKQLRAEKGITQEKLASKAGVSVDFLSLIERGKNAPSFKNIEKIAKAFGVEIKELFSFKKK